MEITVKDNSKIILNELENQKPELLQAIGSELHKSIYNFMTEDKIVDTGRLRGSISFSTPYNDYNQPTYVNKGDDFIKGVREKDTVVYGSNVEYASYVNSGTSRQRARKFMETGTYRAVPTAKRVVEQILKGEE